jgi:hypothetical protein
MALNLQESYTPICHRNRLFRILPRQRTLWPHREPTHFPSRHRKSTNPQRRVISCTSRNQRLRLVTLLSSHGMGVEDSSGGCGIAEFFLLDMRCGRSAMLRIGRSGGC